MLSKKYDFNSITSLGESFIISGEIHISPERWKQLNDDYERDYLKQALSYAMSLTPLPYREISTEEAETDFISLCGLPANRVIKDDEWFTRYEYDNLRDEYQSLIYGSGTIGNKSSDYFHQESRWLCDSINSPSPYRNWTIERFRLTLLNALWSLKYKEVNPTVLRSCIGLRKYIASQFRPSTAKVIYDQYMGGRVLDLSAGWGDRLAGFAASMASEYVGVDPNERLHKGYAEQIEMYARILKRPVNAELIQGCAEEVDLREYGKFDLVFTSPPYFNIERYNQDKTQSFKRYRKVEDWLEGFLFKALDNGWEALRSGGEMMINISDVYSNHRVNNLCDPMVEYMKEKDDFGKLTVAGYEMRKRPNSGALKGKTGIFCEPVWIFSKK